MSDRCAARARSGRSGRGRAFTTLGVVVTLASILTACTGDDGGSDEPDPDPTSPAAQEERTTESTGKAPNYDLSQAVRFDGQVFKAVTSANAVISVDSDGVTTRSLPGAEVAWQLKPAEGFWTDILVEENGDNGYLLSLVSEDKGGTKVGRDSLKVQQIDMTTGDVLAETSTGLPGDSEFAGQTPTTRILGVVGTLVMVDYAYTEDFTYRHNLVALDLTTGEARWMAAGADAISVSSDLIIANTGNTEEPGALVGLDPRTGEQRWSGQKDTNTARLVGRSGNTAVVVRTAPFLTKELVAIDLKTGRQRGAVRDVEQVEWTCHQATGKDALCVLPGGELVGWDIKANSETWRLPTKGRYAPVITYVHDGRAWGKAKGNAWALLDTKDGKVIGEGQGPAPIAANDHGALLNNNGTLEWVPVVS